MSEQRPLLEMNRVLWGDRAHLCQPGDKCQICSQRCFKKKKTKQDFAHPEISICPGWASALVSEPSWTKGLEAQVKPFLSQR